MPSIAVLPFTNMSADPEQEYFCDGMSEEIINALTTLEHLRVSARTSSFKYKGQALDATEIGTQLRVGSILEGSVRKAGNRLRITAQLINVSDGFHLWSERYDRNMDDIFAVQDDIAQTVVEKLKVKLLSVADKPLVKRPTDNLEAYHLVLKGRYYQLRPTGSALEKSLECFTQALALEPTYAQAHAGIAITRGLRSMLSIGPPLQLMPTAKEASLRALAIDETVADARLALAMVLHFYEWDWASAEREYRRALDLNPGDTYARAVYALLLGTEGRADESVAEARSAVERDPLDLHSLHMLALMFQLDRRFDPMMAEARAGIELDQSYHILYWDLGWALVGLGRHDEAVEAFRQAASLEPGDVFSQAYLGSALGLAGQRQEALTILERLERRRTQEYVGGIFLAQVCLGLGEHDQAISWLQQAAEERDSWLVVLNTWPEYDPLRSDPRFQALLKKMNFPPVTSTP